tara:strand:- start:3482 stop:4141 length:660 start_codon:yes stop_codon:yes gene_type:complete
MKTAIIFGSSGLIGSNILSNLLNNSNYNKIKLFVRSEIEISNPKIEIFITDFLNLDLIKDKIIGDDCFFCIGTTHKNTPDKNQYRKIEFNLPINIANIAKINSIKNFLYISSMGANPKAKGTYFRYKGQAEEELKKIGFSKLSLIRPSILVGKRKIFRLGEVIGIQLMKFLSLFFFGNLKNYSPITVETVAKAMINIATGNFNETIYLSDKLKKIALVK